MPYMNVTEVESALIALSSAHPAFCELITLPHATFGGRTTHAVRLGTSPANTVDTYFMTGGVHAREWGSCEILVNLATDLCDAYAGGTGIGYGGKYFSAAEVRAVMEQINVIVFPCVNPDGRDYSQTAAGLWRKNRNPANSGGDPTRIGIDVNRNQDFLWDFRTAFAPAAINLFLASDNPADDTYHGSAPHSEAETQNINYIHDTYARIRWYVDVHSYSEDILYAWGDSESQFSDPTQTFMNHADDGLRGILGGTYKEFIPDADLSDHIRLAEAFTRCLSEVRGKLYVAKPAFSLYPTSGTNDDYAYSRHFADPSKSKAISYTVEWGTTFQPLWTEMQEIIKDVSSGLLGLGLEALGVDSYIVTNRDTFGSYEVESTLSFPESFYVIIDGFSPNALGVPGVTPTIRFLDTLGGATVGAIGTTAAAPLLEQPGALNTPQRITFPFSVDFTDTSPFTLETRVIYLESQIGGMTDVTPMRLLKQPNPYMLDGPVSWLSTDVRVFQLRPGQSVNGFSAVALGDPNADSDAAYKYIRNFIGELRGYGNTPAMAFEAISQDEQASQLELSRTVGGTRVCNFAVAKVRYRANTQDAIDVRVFFRTFNTMVSDLTYTTNPSAYVQNYKRKPDGTIPVLGTNALFSGAGNEIVSIPYFAQARVQSDLQSMDNQIDDTNKQTLVHAGGAEGLQYFGCWLDFNQTEPQFPVQVAGDGPYGNRLPIVQLVRGIHQCLVAEIRYQPGAVDPIGNGASPASSDRLSQRNLAIVESNNPGGDATHVVQHTLLIKPSKTGKFPVAAELVQREDWGGRQDELVIRWNDLPRDALANLYFPDWNADEVLALAAPSEREAGLLRKLDPHTIECKVTDVSYVPIPYRPGDRSPGLLTLQLPHWVVDGQQFHVDVQQHSGTTLRRPGAPAGRDKRQGLGDYTWSMRKTIGSFRVTVAVKLGEPLLAKQVRDLAVLKYIMKAIPTTSSWHPVFVRYVGQLADKVRGLGVDPERVPASPDDPGIPSHRRPRKAYEGKVQEVIYDCFGELEGIVIETCDGSIRLRSRERRIGKLAWKACRDRSVVTVYVSGDEDRTVREFVVRSGWSE
jgi:hypothetical protein